MDGLTYTEECEVIRRVGQGDTEAFARLVPVYQGSLRGFCARYLSHLDAADDIAQETFLRAYQNIQRFEVGTDFGKWLRGIARNLMKDALRRQAREALFKKEEFQARAAELMRWRVSSEDAGDDTEKRLEVLRLCIERLDEKARELLHTCYQAGISAAEVARRCGKALSAIRMQLLRVRRGLKRCVERGIKGEPSA